MARKPGNFKKPPKPRNPVAATLRDPSSGFREKAIPSKKQIKLDRKRKHKGKDLDTDS